MEEHLKHLRTIFEVLKLHQLVAKKIIYVFDNNQVEYLDHVISKERVSTDPNKINVATFFFYSIKIKKHNKKENPKIYI